MVDRKKSYWINFLVVGALAFVAVACTETQPDQIAHKVEFDFSNTALGRSLVLRHFATGAAEEAEARREMHLPKIKPDIGIDYFDLDDDGRPELLVYYNSPLSCGAHGCDFQTFKVGRGLVPLGWSKNSTGITSESQGILILRGKTNGFHDIQFGGPTGHIFRWNGYEYE